MTFAPVQIETRYQPLATKEGLRINIANFARWEDILTAKIVYHAGYPYISIMNKKSWFWFDWKVPLFFGDHLIFRQDVLKYSPQVHPFRTAILEFTGDTNEFRRKYISKVKRQTTRLVVLKVVFFILAVVLLSVAILGIRYGWLN